MSQNDAMQTQDGEQVARLKAAVAVHPLAHASRTAAALFQLCGDMTENLAATARVIADDDMLASGLIRLANRVQHGGGIAVTNTEAATVRLGAGRARGVAIVRLFIERAMRKPVPGFDAKAHWQDAIFRGCIARALAMNTTRNLSCAAFLVGILQDGALPILAATQDKAHARLRADAHGDGLRLAVLESQELGFNHIHTAIRVLERWQAPANVVEAVGRHHTRPPMTRSEQDTLRLWQIAYFVGALPIGPARNEHSDAEHAASACPASDERWADPAVRRMPRETFGLRIGAQRLMEQSRQEFEDVAEFFSPFLPSKIDLDAMTRNAADWLRDGETASNDDAIVRAASHKADRIGSLGSAAIPAARLNEDACIGAQI